MRVAVILICLLITANASLLLPSQVRKMMPKFQSAGVAVATSCTKVVTTDFKVQLPATQSVFSGYLNVAAGSQSGLAFIFYGSQKAKTVAEIPNYPTVIWLNGGPGSSSQIGNFEELGPIRINPDGTQTLNTQSWDSEYNVMFVDQPIGAGFSQFATTDEIPTNQDQVGQHFYYALTEFVGAAKGCVKSNADLAGLTTSPWFLFGESYAGKYVPSISQAILSHTPLVVQLKGIGIGDGFTDPLTITKEMPSFAFNMGLIDYQERQLNERAAIQTTLNIKQGNWLAAQQGFDDVLGQIIEASGGVNVYNLFIFGEYDDDSVDAYLNLPSTKTTFGFNPDYSWDKSSSEVYAKLSEDFMKSDCIARLEYVLTKIPAVIYNGQNDLIVPNPGTLRWVYQLKHAATDKFQQTDFTPWTLENNIVGYAKSAGNLELRIVNKAGHLVPMDQPGPALDLIKSFVESHRK